MTGLIPSKRRTVWLRDGQRCHYCLVPLTLEECTLDHVWPRALRGVDANWNLVAACAGCNNDFADSTHKCRCEFCTAANLMSERGRWSSDATATPVPSLASSVAEATGWRKTDDGWARVTAGGAA